MKNKIAAEASVIKATKFHFTASTITVDEEDKKNPLPVNAPSIFVNDLCKFVAEKWKNFLKTEKINDSPNFQNKIWVIFCGDKGGDTTKLKIMFANIEKPNSIYIPYLLFGGHVQGF